MPDLMIVGDVIEHMRTDLARVRLEFENANDYSQDAAIACGHMALGERVYDFAHNWDQRRKELVEQITTVENNLDMIDTAFGEVDIELSSALDEN
jgi:hypothetical protein